MNTKQERPVAMNHECTGEELRAVLNAAIDLALHHRQYHNPLPDMTVMEVAQGMLAGLGVNPDTRRLLRKALVARGMDPER
jgi:hypothetical protein